MNPIVDEHGRVLCGRPGCGQFLGRVRPVVGQEDDEFGGGWTSRVLAPGSPVGGMTSQELLLGPRWRQDADRVWRHKRQRRASAADKDLVVVPLSAEIQCPQCQSRNLVSGGPRSTLAGSDDYDPRRTTATRARRSGPS